MKIKKIQAQRVGKKYNINFDIIKIEEFHKGLNIEMEHNVKTIKGIAKIVIDHLEEDPRYYYYLEKLEKKRKEFWAKRTKPSIYSKV